jgi:uncharacterized protein (TIGR02145 family)
MRKLLLTTAAVAAAICLAGCGKDDPNTFADSRDGQKYRTVVIGGDRWMAQNLNYQTKSGSWCYNDSASYCKQYGRLYDWKTAKTVCPKGWKLPSSEDWDRLVTTAGGKKIAGKKLKSKSGWNDRDDESSSNGTDSFGFSALPCGFRNSNGHFGYAGNNGYWWTASERHNDYDYAYDWGMIYFDDYVYESNYVKNFGYSVRCVQD